MATDLGPLETEVERIKGVVPSVTTLITRLLSDVEAEKEDPARVQAIVDGFRAEIDTLAAAVAANPGPTPPPA